VFRDKKTDCGCVLILPAIGSKWNCNIMIHRRSIWNAKSSPRERCRSSF
jgi:hypothetical protein